jgi:DNA-binding NarL/FixJ family response regulator
MKSKGPLSSEGQLGNSVKAKVQPQVRQDSSSSKKARIFLVDDHPIVRKGLEEILNHEDDFVICGQATRASEALQAILSTSPDLVILDLSLDGTNGIELLKQLKISCSGLSVLVLTMHDESLFAERALQAGARGYIMKHEALTNLHTAIRRVLGGGIYLSDSMSQRLLERATKKNSEEASSDFHRLSDRELEVLQMIGQGLGTSAIAAKLHLSVKTVETYRANLKQKLRLTNAAELVRYAVSWVQAV